jgi:hypothetical protein
VNKPKLNKLTKQNYTFNRENWSGNNASITVYERTLEDGTREGSFSLYEYTFNVTITKHQDRPYPDEQTFRWERAKITSKEVGKGITLGIAIRFEDDKAWEFFSGESISESAISRSDENPYVAAAKLLSNTI